MREEKFAGRLPSLLTMAGFFLLWEVLARRMNAAYILPAPTQIVKRIYELRAPLFLVHLPATMAVVALSLTISAALGIFLAVLRAEPRSGRSTRFLSLRRPYRPPRSRRSLCSGSATGFGARCWRPCS